ncbi:MAG: tetratricopeptide repeat protein [Verrucomicrobiota bacterium]|jgi:hypothetical protein|nr:tetratricopeptide repeat protein [Verrucomicrobiota bacterium]
MRVAFLFGVVSQVGLALFLCSGHAQQVDNKPTRGDGLVAKLKAIEPKLKATFSELKQNAEDGDGAAQERVSQLLEHGQGVAVDLKAAFSWAEKSADGGYGLGEFRLGLMYRFGTGIEPDEKRSNQWLLKAAKSLPALVEQKNTKAMQALATLHYRGWGDLDQDRVKALELNQQAADAGDVLALVEVADQLWDGKGTRRQRTKAKNLYKKALPMLMDLGETGDREAQFIVGNLLAGLRMGARDFEESIKWQHPGADAGYPAAQFLIGARHQKGHGMPQNDAIAMDWYNKAAAQGHPGAINNVGWMHGTGRVAGGADGAKASAMYLRAAERGNSVSQNNIAMRLFSGADIAQDKEKAFEWHKRSAENDYGRGQYYLAMRFDTGEGTEPNLERAVYWYKRAAENDEINSQAKLAQMYRDGRGVKRNLRESLNWLARVTEFERDKVNPFFAREQASARSAAQGYVKLKKYVDEGWPVSPRDLNEVQAEAEKGDANAQYELAALNAGGVGGLTESTKTAYQWAAKAAAQGHAGAQYYLGICHEEGRNVSRSSAKAREWYQKAAAQDHAGAQNNLAAILEETASMEEAGPLYLKAAKGGSANGCYNLARLIETGTGGLGEADPKAAFEEFSKAARMGHGPAQNNLGLMYQMGVGVKANLEESVRWYQYAANQDNLDAQFNLGLMTLRGEGGLKADKVKAFVLWGRAAMKAHRQATENLAALANELTEDEKNQGRAEVREWTQNHKVLQYFVIREGD